MKTDDSLKKLERRAYRSTFNDGIYDIQFGLLFMVFAWIPVLEALGISRFYTYPLLLFPLIVPPIGKRMVTIPRMGSVEFGQKRKSRKTISLIIGAFILVLTLPLIIMIYKDSISGQLGWTLVAAFAAPILVVAVYSMDFPRLYIYAALLIAGVVESEMLRSYVGAPYDAVISFGLPGFIILMIGIVMLYRFLRDYPKGNVEAGSAVG